jgi:hypothetical protein
MNGEAGWRSSVPRRMAEPAIVAATMGSVANATKKITTRAYRR